MDYAIEYSGFSVVLEGYNDVNWISDSDETKSTSGYVFTLGDSESTRLKKCFFVLCSSVFQQGQHNHDQGTSLEPLINKDSYWWLKRRVQEEVRSHATKNKNRSRKKDETQLTEQRNWSVQIKELTTRE